MKKLLFISIILSSFSVGGLFSQSIVDFSNETTKNGEVNELLNIQDYTVFNGSCYKIYTPKVSSKAPFTSDEQIATVTLKYECPANVSPTLMAVYGKDIQAQNINYDPKTKKMSYDVKLPIDKTYGMHALFKARPTMSWYVFKENIKILRDTTIVFNQAEATNTIKITSVDENGEVLSPDLYDGGSKILGKAKAYRTTSFFAHKDYGVISTIIGGSYKVKGYDIDFYTNKISVNYHLYQGRQIGTNEGKRYFIGFDIPIGEEKIEIQNDPKDYKLYEQKFSSSKTGEVKESHIPGYYLYTVYDGNPVVGSKSYNTKTILEEPIVKCMASNIVSKDGKFSYLISPLFGDERIGQTINGQTNYKFKFINGTPMYTNEKGEFVSSLYGYGIYNGYSIIEKTNQQKVYPGHPDFSFIIKPDNNYVYGNNCPILSTQLRPKSGSISVRATYLGRYGEEREADLSKLKSSQKQEGSVFKMTFINENILVDGMSGKNEAVLEFETSAKDKLTPTIQMLQMKNKEGLITDRFSTNKDGIIEIAGGDFEYNLNEDKKSAYYTFKEASLRVFYTSHNSDNWKELKAEEDKTKFYMPGFGSFYTVKLEQIESCPKGWYDLNLELTDQAGNKQIQTISPAFFIGEDHVSIEEVPNDALQILQEGSSIRLVNSNGKPNIKVYSINGTIIINHDGDAINTQGLPSGTYIVVATEGINKSVKKVMID